MFDIQIQHRLRYDMENLINTHLNLKQVLIEFTKPNLSLKLFFIGMPQRRRKKTSKTRNPLPPIPPTQTTSSHNYPSAPYSSNPALEVKSDLHPSYHHTPVLQVTCPQHLPPFFILVVLRRQLPPRLRELTRHYRGWRVLPIV